MKALVVLSFSVNRALVLYTQQGGEYMYGDWGEQELIDSRLKELLQMFIYDLFESVSICDLFCRQIKR